jgi:hypothetical protein
VGLDLDCGGVWHGAVRFGVVGYGKDYGSVGRGAAWSGVIR